MMPGRMRSWECLGWAVLACLPFCGCRSTAPSLAEDARLKAIPPLPCSISVIFPVPPGEGLIAEPGVLPVDWDRLEDSLVSEFEGLRVSTDVSVLRPTGASEDLRPASADLILELDPGGPPTYAFAYRNTWFFPNTFLWFLAGFPSFWIADRVYQVRWDVNLKVSAACGRGGPQTVRLRLERDQALSVAEQGWTAKVLYTPPGFYEGPNATESLVSLAETWLVDELAGFLKSESERPAVLSLLSDVGISIGSPQNFADVSAGGASLEMAIHSPTLLERLRVEVDGERVLEKNPLTMPRASRIPSRGTPNDVFAYEFRAPLAEAPGEHLVRILAARSEEGAARDSESVQTWSATRTIRYTVGGEATAEEPAAPAGE